MSLPGILCGSVALTPEERSKPAEHRKLAAGYYSSKPAMAAFEDAVEKLRGSYRSLIESMEDPESGVQSESYTIHLGFSVEALGRDVGARRIVHAEEEE